MQNSSAGLIDIVTHLRGHSTFQDSETTDLLMLRRPGARYSSFQNALHDDTQPEFDLRDLIAGSSDTLFKSNDSFIKPPYGIPKPAPQHPFARNFEAPHWTLLLVHIGLCLTTYPLLMIFTVIARAKSLFWARFWIGVGCGLTGFLLAFSLLRLGRKFLESATWATVIHQSRVIDAPGIKLNDLATKTSDPLSAWAGLRLLWNRHLCEGTSRKYRQGYDRRPWSLFILFFLLIVGVAASSPFVFGRIIQIDTVIIHQWERYNEVAVKGGSSGADVEHANAIMRMLEDDTLMWTLAPFSDHGGLPPAVSFKWSNHTAKDYTVYFSETAASQLLPNGSGFGTFDNSTMDPSTKVDSQRQWWGSTSSASNDTDLGSILRFPRWGIRIRCTKISDGENNLITRSPNNFTYVFTPAETLRSLYSSFEMDYPATIAPFNASLNASQVLKFNDTLPPGLNVSETVLGAAFYDNGVAHSFYSLPVTLGQEGFGWTSIEHVLVRLNTSYTPNGTFLGKSANYMPDKDGNPTFIGYDAAVCLELFEPWIVDTYRSAANLPASVELIQPGSGVEDVQLKEKRIGQPLTDVSRQLNSSELRDVYVSAHQNSIHQMLKDNARDFYYVPNPTVISYTNGEGPYGYTELSANHFAQARGLADATNILPYFIGSGDTLARSYPDSVSSTAYIHPRYMFLYIGFLLVLGLLAGLFVPKLPLGVPHRGFGLYSWVAAFQADELVSEKELEITRNMELGEISSLVGDLKFRHVTTNSN